MLGAIIGDVIGSVYEKQNNKRKEVPLFSEKSTFTDDTVLTVAVGDAFLQLKETWRQAPIEHRSTLASTAVEQSLRQMAKMYPKAGYGRGFKSWLQSPVGTVGEGFGNGSAMRISPVAYVAQSLEEVQWLSHVVTGTSHNHPEALRGAEAIAVAVYLARQRRSKQEIQTHLLSYDSWDTSVEMLQATYAFDSRAAHSVPQALQCFFESYDFESAIRNAIGIGGDADTLAAIAGSVAGAYYGIPKELEEEVWQRLDDRLRRKIAAFRENIMGAS